MFIYISFQDEDIELAKALASSFVKNRMYPFLPRLSKLVKDISVDDWIKYYSAWLHKCDCMYATSSAREHELNYAKDNGIPIVRTWQELLSVQLPPYGEIARQFGKFAVSELEANEAWRYKEVKEMIIAVEEQTGRLPEDKTKALARLKDITARIVRAWDALGGFRV